MKKKFNFMYIILIAIGAMYTVALFQNQKMRILCERSHSHNTNITRILDMTNEAYAHSAISGKFVLKEKVETNNGIINFSDTICKDQLFLYFTESSCNPCIKRELENVSKLSKNGYNVFLIGVFSSQREMKSLLSKYDIDSHYINISRNTSIFEDGRIPVSNLEYFMIDENRTIYNTFIPVQRNDTLSVEYLSMLHLIDESK